MDLEVPPALHGSLGETAGVKSAFIENSRPPQFYLTVTEIVTGYNRPQYEIPRDRLQTDIAQKQCQNLLCNILTRQQQQTSNEQVIG